MNDVSPGPGHNLGIPSQAALLELLREETAALAAKAFEYIVCADERSEVVDDETAKKAVQLEATMIEIYEELETLRTDTKKPFLDAGRVIDAHFHEITLPLIGPNPGKKREGAIGDLHARIEAYDNARRAEIEAEKQRLEAEARAQQEAAERAEQARQDALDRAKSTTDPAQQAAEYRAATEAAGAARRAQDEAAKTAAAAASQVARPIDSGVGPKATRRINWVVEIDDTETAVAHCLTMPPARALIQIIVQRTYAALVRAGARDSVLPDGTPVRGLPGARILDQSKLQVRRK